MTFITMYESKDMYLAQDEEGNIAPCTKWFEDEDAPHGWRGPGQFGELLARGLVVFATHRNGHNQQYKDEIAKPETKLLWSAAFREVAPLLWSDE